MRVVSNPNDNTATSAVFDKGSGLIVVALPNMANITVRLKLLFGKFDYQERGIMDKTHLRWFTRRTARKLLEDHGYRIVEERITNIPVDLALGMSPTSFLTRAIHRVLRVFTVDARTVGLPNHAGGARGRFH
jgi:hypothetical protein